MILPVSQHMGVRKSYAHIPDILEMPNLIQIQQESYRRICDPSQMGGLRDLFAEVSPIKDFTGSRYELHFPSYGFGNNAELPDFPDEKAFWDYIWANAK